MRQGDQIKRLGELFRFRNGRAFKKEEWTSAGLPIIRIQNLNNEDAAFNYFAGEFSQDILVEPGDLLFSWSGTVGSSFGSHIWSREPGVLNQHIFKVGHGDEIGKRYAFYALRYITKEIEQQVSGAVGLVHITKERLNEFKIPVPVLERQQRIVAILDEAFADIATAKTNAEKNLWNARALLAGFTKDQLNHGNGQWINAKLGDVCELYQPQTISGKDLIDGGKYRVYGANGPIGWYDRFNHEDPQLMITCRGATCGTINRSEAKAWITGNSMIVRPRAGVELDISFLEVLLRHGIDLSATITGAAQPQITRANLAPLKIKYPASLAVQKGIVGRFAVCSSETQQLQSLYTRKLAALDELKQSLLHQAFSGQL